MSKMDELRALREARYEESLARAAAHRSGRAAAQRADPAVRTARPVPRSAEAQQRADEPVEADHEVRLCGHRAISGRTCTREHGHAAKSHRYS